MLEASAKKKLILGESRQSFRSDGYAIGMVLYELLSGGKRLFTLKEKDIVSFLVCLLVACTRLYSSLCLSVRNHFAFFDVL